MFIQITILHSFLCWPKALFRNEYNYMVEHTLQEGQGTKEIAARENNSKQRAK